MSVLLQTKLTGLIQVQGPTVVWHPPTNTYVYMTGYSYFVKPDTTTPAGARVTMTDAGTDIINLGSLSVGAYGNFPAVPVAMNYQFSGDLGIRIDATPSSGGVYLTVWGYETRLS